MDLLAYIRVSKVGDRQGDSYQTEDQQRTAIDAIVALTPGARVIGTHIDRDQSGGTMDRPEVQKVIRAVESGRADGVVVAYLDRWARTLEALEMIERWSREGKAFISARDKFDATTSQGKFALGMMLLVAKYYRDTITERWDEAAKNAVERGVHTTVPYGYRRGEGNGKAHAKGGTRGAPLVTDRVEAPNVQRIFAERLTGNSASMIADSLNGDGIPSAKGKRWNRQSVRAILKSRTYLGEARRERKGRDPLVTEDAHEALVSEADWKAVQQEKRSYKKRSSRLLDSLVRCGGCGYAMGPSSSGGQRWNCNRHHAELECPSPTTAPVDGLEEIVAEEFLSHYGDIEVQGALTVTSDVQDAESALGRATDELARWRDDVEMREVLGDADYRAGLMTRKQAMNVAEEAHREAVRLAGASDLAIDPNLWDTLTLSERRELVCAGVEAVVVSRAASTHTPLADRVKIIWPGELDHDGTRSAIAAAIRQRPRAARMSASEDGSESMADLVTT
jgi:DNA invertase Pin-like site-specific DNA recombinase